MVEFLDSKLQLGLMKILKNTEKNQGKRMRDNLSLFGKDFQILFGGKFLMTIQSSQISIL